jgi:hypothetical protein
MQKEEVIGKTKERLLCAIHSKRVEASMKLTNLASSLLMLFQFKSEVNVDESVFMLNAVVKHDLGEFVFVF